MHLGHGITLRLVRLCALALTALSLSGLSQTLNLPPRPSGALTGSQFIKLITPMSVTERENHIYAQVMSGNVPNFLRSLVPVTMSGTINGTGHTLIYYAAPEYLAIGSDVDYFLEPVSPLLAQRLCDALGCTLPTRKMVNQIWTNAPVKLTPVPFSPATYDILSVAVFSMENDAVRSQRDAKTNSFPLGALTGGCKKDIIISSKIYTNFANGPTITKVVVIYGWHYPDGSFIQSLYNGHEETYADYSHGARLVQNAVLLDGVPNTITNILTDPNLAGLLSDEGASEATSAGVITRPRYTVAAVAPVITGHPRSQTLYPGGTATFRLLAAGDPTLAYRWLSNGVTIANATNSTFVLTNVQALNAAAYSVVVTNGSGSAASRVANLKIGTNPLPLLFSDNFEVNTSTNWSLFWGASNGIPDYTVDWAWDHGGKPASFNGAHQPIPPAPNSAEGSTRGVRLTVNNNDATGSTAGVNIYPLGQKYSGNFALKFDLWINYPGNAGGAGTGIVGSTEHAIFGINHTGTEVNWAAPSASSSDGIWFAADGEGGTTRDYRSYVGNPAGLATELTGVSSGLIATDAVSTVYQTLFPASRFETAGSPGKNWVEVELRQTNDLVSWILDGTVVAQRVNSSQYTSGNIMLGFMDLFASIATPAADGFVLYDNVRVEDLSGQPKIMSATRSPNQQVRMSFSAIPGSSYEVQGSSNLVDWSMLSTVISTNGPVTFTDTTVAEAPLRFYRIRGL
jgi:hypothetical protein